MIGLAAPIISTSETLPFDDRENSKPQESSAPNCTVKLETEIMLPKDDTNLATDSFSPEVIGRGIILVLKNLEEIW